MSVTAGQGHVDHCQEWAEHGHCGCCGACITDDRIWCKQCVRHVGRKVGHPPWDRTYEALHGRPCPHQR